MTAARFARLTSAAINSRSTAAVERRSSHRAIGNSVILAKLRAKALAKKAAKSKGEVARESAGRLRPRTFRAVHVDRQTQNEADHAALGGERKHALSVGRESLARHGLDRSGNPAIRVAHRHADGLGAEIEPDQRASRGQVSGSFGERQDDGHGRAVARVKTIANARAAR